jgi:hypothetical protein
MIEMMKMVMKLVDLIKVFETLLPDPAELDYYQYPP